MSHSSCNHKNNDLFRQQTPVGIKATITSPCVCGGWRRADWCWWGWKELEADRLWACKHTALVFGRLPWEGCSIIPHLNFISFNVVAAEMFQLCLTVTLIAPHRVQTCDPPALPPPLEEPPVSLRWCQIRRASRQRPVYLLSPNQRNSTDWNTLWPIGQGQVLLLFPWSSSSRENDSVISWEQTLLSMSHSPLLMGLFSKWLSNLQVCTHSFTVNAWLELHRSSFKQTGGLPALFSLSPGRQTGIAWPCSKNKWAGQNPLTVSTAGKY